MGHGTGDCISTEERYCTSCVAEEQRKCVATSQQCSVSCKKARCRQRVQRTGKERHDLNYALWYRQMITGLWFLCNTDRDTSLAPCCPHILRASELPSISGCSHTIIHIRPSTGAPRWTTTTVKRRAVKSPDSSNMVADSAAFVAVISTVVAVDCFAPGPGGIKLFRRQ